MLAALLSCLWLPISCGSDHSSGHSPVQSIGELKPDALASPKGSLVLDRTPIPITVVREQKGGEVAFLISIDKDTPLEVERYVLGAAAFSVREVAGESFVAPLPLLKYPIVIGETKTWEGEMRSGDIAHPTKAKITTTYEPEVLKVEVALEVDGGAPKPALRSLVFWFKPGKGIVKREFGASSTRLALEP